MNTDNFVWNDELVKEYAAHLIVGKSCGITNADEHLRQFKLSKQPPIGSKDYEILEGFNIEDGIHPWADDLTKVGRGGTTCYQKKCTIHSVRRISDGEVFTVGDMFSNNTAGFYTEEKVCSIELDKEQNIIKIRTAEGENKEYYPLDDSLIKLPTPSPKEEDKVKINGHTVHYELGDNGVPNIISIAGYIFYPALNAQKTYTQSEADAMILEAESKAFYAAREIDVTQYKNMDIEKKFCYPTFSDYKQIKSEPAPSIVQEKKEALFTTEDGVEVSKGDTFWWVCADETESYGWKVNDCKADENVFPFHELTHPFSTPEAAEQYILENKPCLSANDIKWWLEKYFNYPDGISVNQLKELVKQKLNS